MFAVDVQLSNARSGSIDGYSDGLSQVPGAIPPFHLPAGLFPWSDLCIPAPFISRLSLCLSRVKETAMKTRITKDSLGGGDVAWIAFPLSRIDHADEAPM